MGLLVQGRPCRLGPLEPLDEGPVLGDGVLEGAGQRRMALAELVHIGENGRLACLSAPCGGGHVAVGFGIGLGGVPAAPWRLER